MHLFNNVAFDEADLINLLCRPGVGIDSLYSRATFPCKSKWPRAQEALPWPRFPSEMEIDGTRLVSGRLEGLVLGGLNYSSACEPLMFFD